MSNAALFNAPQNLKGKSGIKSEVGTPESNGRKSLDGGTPQRDLLYKHSFTDSGFGNGSFSGSFSNGPLSAGRGGRDSAKSDAKVLEWGSFAPSVIREYYLTRMQS